MSTDPIRGKTLRWTFDDGPMKGKAFEHTFGADGTVTYREVDAKPAAGAPAKADGPKTKYEIAQINDDVYAVSYLSPSSGFTLTTVLDFGTSTAVGFASNDKQLIVQHGHFEAAKHAA